MASISNSFKVLVQSQPIQQPCKVMIDHQGVQAHLSLNLRSNIPLSLSKRQENLTKSILSKFSRESASPDLINKVKTALEKVLTVKAIGMNITCNMEQFLNSKAPIIQVKLRIPERQEMSFSCQIKERSHAENEILQKIVKKLKMFYGENFHYDQNRITMQIKSQLDNLYQASLSYQKSSKVKRLMVEKQTMLVGVNITYDFSETMKIETNTVVSVELNIPKKEKMKFLFVIKDESTLDSDLLRVIKGQLERLGKPDFPYNEQHIVNQIRIQVDEVYKKIVHLMRYD